jgi:hypothetical protein
MSAADYCKAGWALVPIELGTKGPKRKGWNTRARCLTDPEVAAEWQGNLGLAHAYSGTCAVDVDELEGAANWLLMRGISLQTLLEAPDAVMIFSGRKGRAKLLYRIPEPLQSFKLADGALELRCATADGKTVQDVLPPSIHPETKKPYEWAYGDDLVGHWSVLPMIPKALFALWKGLIPLPSDKGPKAVGEAPQDALWALLAHRDPDAGYDDWIKAGMALHHETDGAEHGLDLWDLWSSGGTKYKGRDDLENHWRSFRANSANAVTIATLKRDTPASPEEFEIVGPAEDGELRGEEPVLDSHQGLALPTTLRRNEAGKNLAILPNLDIMLSEPGYCGWELRLDSFKDVVLISGRGEDNWRPFKDSDYTRLRLWMEQSRAFMPVAKDLVRDAVHLIAERNEMDSAQEWLATVKWDGKPRIERFLPDYFGTIDAAYERAVGLYLWTALAGRVMDPGCQVDMVPIFVGPEGIGKSTGIKAMVPATDWYVEIRLDEPDDVIARKMRGTVIGEIAELRGLNTVAAERVKAFVTRTHEKWTPKFMEYSTTFARRLVMVGTSNPDEFLGEGENRRWLPVRTAGARVSAIVRDRDQLWAEARDRWAVQGVVWHTAETLAKEHHAEFKVEDGWAATVALWLKEAEEDGGAPREKGYVRLADVLIRALGLDSRHVTRIQELRVAKILRELGYKKHVCLIDGVRGKAWVKE